MRKLYSILFIFSTLSGQSQLIVNVQTPAGGMAEKNQLWNMTITNTTTTSLQVQVEVIFSDDEDKQPVFTGVSRLFTINSGTTQFNTATLNPIQYNILNSNFHIDASPNGLLPIGNFNICYNFLVLNKNRMIKIAEDCGQLNIPPISPPLLTYPNDQATIEEINPQLGWLPPAPINFFPNLRYDLRLTEILSDQSAQDALQTNIPLLSQYGIASITLIYPLDAKPLEIHKTYAWQITANAGLHEIAKSEIWQFTIDQPKNSLLPDPDAPYVKLRKDNQENFVVFFGKIRFDYLNETPDTILKVLVQDLTAPQHSSFVLSPNGGILKEGQNLVEYDATGDRRFINNHLYLFQIPNSRNEVWQLRFQYRK